MTKRHVSPRLEVPTVVKNDLKMKIKGNFLSDRFYHGGYFGLGEMALQNVLFVVVYLIYEGQL